MSRTSFAYLILCFFHSLYVLLVSITTWLQRHNWQPPQPLAAKRSKLPAHLCLILVADDKTSKTETETAFLQCLQRVATWCQALGIETLTVYDRDGILAGCLEAVRDRVFAMEERSDESSESEVDYPLTPPLSEPSLSRNQSPDRTGPPVAPGVITVKGTTLYTHSNVSVWPNTSSQLTLHIASRASAKPAVASASRSLLDSYIRNTVLTGETLSGADYSLASHELGLVLEGALPQPDFMIVHHVSGLKAPYPPLELHGFPPWQITLTEFYRTHPKDTQESCLWKSKASCTLISETAFCRALDEYAGAQFRLGK